MSITITPTNMMDVKLNAKKTVSIENAVSMAFIIFTDSAPTPKVNTNFDP